MPHPEGPLNQAFLGYQKPSIAPVGSVMMLNEPAPSDLALLVAALMSST